MKGILERKEHKDVVNTSKGKHKNNEKKSYFNF